MLAGALILWLCVITSYSIHYTKLYEIPALLAQLADWPAEPQAADLQRLSRWLVRQSATSPGTWDLARANQLLSQLQQQCPGELTNAGWARPVLLDALIEEFSRD